MRKIMTLNEVYAQFAQRAIDAGYTQDEIVYGHGDASSPIVLVGEAPGKDEIRLKRPFVGKAGKNLDEFLEKTGIKRDELFITNTVKMRPYKISEKGTRSNRPPTAKEKALCADCLSQELETISPKLVVTLGNTALKALLGKDASIGALHGTVQNMPQGYALFALYHPASVIYRRELTAVYQEDLAKLREYIDTQMQIK